MYCGRDMVSSTRLRAETRSKERMGENNLLGVGRGDECGEVEVKEWVATRGLGSPSSSTTFSFPFRVMAHTGDESKSY